PAALPRRRPPRPSSSVPAIPEEPREPGTPRPRVVGATARACRRGPGGRRNRGCCAVRDGREQQRPRRGLGLPAGLLAAAAWAGFAVLTVAGAASTVRRR